MKTLWAIVKDGLIALIFWLVTSMVLIYYLGYPGRLLSQFLGMILIISFCALRLKQLVNFLARGRGAGGPPPGGWPSYPAEGHGWKACPKCSGGSVTCPSCAGAGSWYLGGREQICSGCGGARYLTCMNCSGSGQIYR